MSLSGQPLLKTWAVDDLRGRAAFTRFNQDLHDGINALVLEMRAVAKEAHIKETRLRLVMAKRNTDGMMNLRWHQDGKNVTWGAASQTLGQWPANIQRHYERLNRRVMELNAMSQMMSSCRKKIRDLAEDMGWRDNRVHL